MSDGSSLVATRLVITFLLLVNFVVYHSLEHQPPLPVHISKTANHYPNYYILLLAAVYATFKYIRTNSKLYDYVTPTRVYRLVFVIIEELYKTPTPSNLLKLIDWYSECFEIYTIPIGLIGLAVFSDASYWTLHLCCATLFFVSASLTVKRKNRIAFYLFCACNILAMLGLLYNIAIVGNVFERQALQPITQYIRVAILLLYMH